MDLTDFQKQVYKVTKRIPKGKVATYFEVAKAIGKPKTVRAVGSALNKNPFTCLAEAPKDSERRQGPRVPCHRVVKSNGDVGGFASGTKEKIKMLEEEGIKIENRKVVNFEKVLFKF